MKISNFSKLMLIAAMALVGNAAYKMLQNRTGSSCCSAAIASECCAQQASCCGSAAVDAVEQAPIAHESAPEIAPIQTAMNASDEDTEGMDHDDDSDMYSQPGMDMNNDINEDEDSSEQEDMDDIP